MKDVKSPVDLDRVRLTSDGDRVFESELFAIFIEDCADRITRLQGAIAAKDLESIHHEAHTVKGAAANVGARHLCEIALCIEKANTMDDPDATQTLLKALCAEYQRVKDFVQEHYNV
jgi:histidine phosphotransfer protein HptB